MLCWLFYKLVFRVWPRQLVLCDSTLICPENGCAWISINITTVIWRNHETQMQLYKHFAFCYCKTIFVNIYFILKAYKSKGLYFTLCRCAIILSKLLECWLCVNVNLVLLWISRMLGTRWQCMTVLPILNNSVESLIF